MRKQYFFRPSDRGLLAWDVDRLIQLTATLPRRRVRLTQIDLAFPIILSADGSVMDGMHRVAKAVRAGHDGIDAVRFERDPEPDYVGRGPDDLPYGAAEG